MIPDEILNPLMEEIAGEDIIPLVQLIKGRSNVSEFKIAEKLNLTVNHVRNMLYRLNSHNLADFTRKKDKKKGWYVYYWTLDTPRIRNLGIKIKKGMINTLNERIAKEKTKEYFVCPDKHIRSDLENAMEIMFRCPECDLPLVKENNEKLIKNILKKIESLKQEIEVLENLKIKPIVERKLTREPKKTITEKKVPKKSKAKKKKASGIVTAKKKTIKKPPEKRTVKKKTIRRKLKNIFYRTGKKS